MSPTSSSSATPITTDPTGPCPPNTCCPLPGQFGGSGGPGAPGGPGAAGGGTGSCTGAKCEYSGPTRFSRFPVRYFNGEIRMVVDDLASGGFGTGWGHRRIYSNRLSENHNFGNGYNWMVQQWPYLAEEDGGDTIVVTFEPLEAFWFDKVGDDYVARFGAMQTLTHDDVNHVFKLTYPGGQVWEFHDFDQDACPQGLFKRMTSAGGQATEVDSYNADGHIAEVRRSTTSGGSTVTESYLYDYYVISIPEEEPSGDLASVTLRRRVDDGEWQNVRRVQYSYYTDGDDHGGDHDLKTATHQHPNGAGWVNGDVYYYRYYTGGEANGFAHGLKYALEPREYQNLADDPQVADPLTASDAKVAQYASYYYEYNADRRVTAEKVAGAGLECSFAFVDGTHADGYNQWRRKTTETWSDGSRLVVYSNHIGQVLLKELVFGEESWTEFWQYDDDARVILHAGPSAVSGYADDAGSGGDELSVTLKSDEGLIHVFDYYASTTTGSGGGAVEGYKQYDAIKQGADGTEVKLGRYEYAQHTAGGITVYPVAREIEYRNDDGTGAVETSYGYTWHSGTVAVLQRLATLPAVPASQNGSGTPATRTERFDVYGNLVWSKDERGYVAYSEYDPATGAPVKTIQDVDGTRLTLPADWTTPAGGGLHLVTDYEHDEQGRVTQILGPEHRAVGDPDAESTADLLPVEQWEAITVRSAAWTVYDDTNREVRTARGYALLADDEGSSSGSSSGSEPGDTYVLVNPVSISKQDAAGRQIESIRATRASTRGRLSADDTFPQSSYVGWSTSQYNTRGQLLSSRVYHTIPPTGQGSAGTHYDQTDYDYDSMGRQNMAQTPGGTITRTVFNFKGQPTAVYVGTDDSGATDGDPTGASSSGSSSGGGTNNMVLVSEHQYAGSGGCGACGAGGPGQLTQLTQHVDADTARITEYLYDWRNRQEFVLTDRDDQNRWTFTKNCYDNLDRVVRAERFHDVDGDGPDPLEGEHLDDVLIARQETSYDDRGRVYRTRTYAVDPATGTVGNSLAGHTWYDDAGNPIKQQAAGTRAFTKTTYDGLGRRFEQFTGFDLDETPEPDPSSSGSSSGPADTAYDDACTLTDDTILEQHRTEYDAAGNVLLSTTWRRIHDATGTGRLNGPGGPQPTARAGYAAAWHDGVGRQVASADYGTAGGTAPTRPETVPERSDTVLVATTEHDAAGRACQTTDPAAKVARAEFDDAGRQVRSVQNYVAVEDSSSSGSTCDCSGCDVNVTTETTYNADGLVLTLTARNSVTGDQTTRYVYGSTLADSDVARADLLGAEVYPDSDDTAEPLGDGPDGLYDRVEYHYNRQGERTGKKDQNGTVHRYVHDNLGRLLEDRVTAVGSGTDDAVRSIVTSYEVRGMVAKITSYAVGPAPPADSSSSSSVGPAVPADVVNQVLFQYNDFGRPVAEYQEHDGVVSTLTSPKVGYSYTDGTGGHTRRTQVVYPNGRILRYEYDSDADDAVNRPSFLADDDDGSVGTQLAEYSYLGLGHIVRVDYPEPGLRYDLAHGTGADPYAGLDRFGRVVDLLWHRIDGSSSSGETETDVVRIRHGYDRAGNRLWREDPVAASYGKHFDELYTYDGMNQLIDLQRGDLNANKTAVTSKTFAESWTLDPTGNWCTFRQDTDGDGDWDLDQGRTHNEVNELTGISEDPGQTPWADPVHDAVGNMTSLPKRSDPEESLTAKYDAWNRLVEVSDDGVLIARFRYDGLDRRILKAMDRNASGSLDCFQHIFLADEQVIETRETDTESDPPESIQPKYQQVWSPHYIDWLIVRDENTDTDAACDDARIYYLADANYNVTALADNAGSVVERYVYSAYGEVTVLDSDGSPDTDNVSDHDNTTLYTGRELDPSTGLYYYRARYYHAGLGRFVARDPIGFAAGEVQLYTYLSNSPLDALDPLGLQQAQPSPQPGTPVICNDESIDRVLRYAADKDAPIWNRPGGVNLRRGYAKVSGLAKHCNVHIYCGDCDGNSGATFQAGGYIHICLDSDEIQTEEFMLLVIHHELIHVNQRLDFGTDQQPSKHRCCRKTPYQGGVPTLPAPDSNCERCKANEQKAYTNLCLYYFRPGSRSLRACTDSLTCRACGTFCQQTRKPPQWYDREGNLNCRPMPQAPEGVVVPPELQ